MNKEMKHHVTERRAIYIMGKLNKHYSIQMIQAYAPTPTSSEEEVKLFYKDLITAKMQKK